MTRIEREFTNKFKNYCQDGKPDEAKKLFESNPNITKYICDKAFYGACTNGHLELAKWLINIYPDIDVSSEDFFIFTCTCMEGHLEVAKWLLLVKPCINVSTNEDFPFSCSCGHGRFEVAKWLLSVKPSINVSARCEMPFTCACYGGYLNIAQWLLSVKPTINISAQDDYAFRMACWFNHLDLALWLQSLLPGKYDLIIENDKIISYNINKNILPVSNININLNYYNNDEVLCSICYDETKKIELQTNCKHNFCKKCIIQYYNNQIEKNNICNCPYCRQTINSFSKLQLTYCGASSGL